MTEPAHWRPIPEFEGYEVSDDGHVRRIAGGRGAVVGRVLAQATMPSGYRTVGLWDANQPRVMLVHRLVAAAFLGPCPVGMEVNHLDMDKANNRPSNLEYVTRSENLRHRARAGIGRGSDNVASRLTEEQVRDIRADYRRGGGPGYKALAARYDVSWEAIRNIIKRGAWGWMA